MPRKNSTTRSVGEDITASRLNDINEDFDDLYLNGPDRLRVYLAISGTPLRIDISAGAYYIGSSQGVYGGGTDIVVTDTATNYVMIDNAGSITISTSARTAGLGRLAQVICAGGAVTDIILRNNMVFGGAALDLTALSVATGIIDGDTMLIYRPLVGNMQIDAMRFNIQKSFECAEDIAVGDVVRLGTAANDLAGSTVDTVGGTSFLNPSSFIAYNTTHRKKAQSFTVVTGGVIDTITVTLRKSGSPAGQVTCKVFSDTGTTLVETASNTVSEAGLTTSYADYVFTFSGTKKLLPGTFYVELSTSRADSTSNYIGRGTSGSSTYAGGNAYRINSSGTWSSQASVEYDAIIVLDPFAEDLSKIYVGSSSLTTNIGIAESSESQGDQCTVTMKGIATASGLTPQTKYEISTLGNITTFGAGKYIGFALSATQLFVDIDKGIA